MTQTLHAGVMLLVGIGIGLIWPFLAADARDTANAWRAARAIRRYRRHHREQTPPPASGHFNCRCRIIPTTKGTPDK